VVRLCGADNGAKCGVGFGTPLAAEAVSDFAEDHAGTQVPLGHIIGVGHAPVGDEHEEMAAVGGNALAQFAPRLADRDGRHDAIEPAIQIGVILLERGVFQRVSSPPDGDRAQQQTLERGAEGDIAALDSLPRRRPGA
jgi:hypothetical protein